MEQMMKIRMHYTLTLQTKLKLFIYRNTVRSTVKKGFSKVLLGH